MFEPKRSKAGEWTTPHQTHAVAQPHAATRGHESRDRRTDSAVGANSTRTCDLGGYYQDVSPRRFPFSTVRPCERKAWCTYAMAGCQPNWASYYRWALAVWEAGSARVLPRVATCAVCIRRSNASKNKGRFPCCLAALALAGPLNLWLLCTEYARAAVPDLSSSSSFPFFSG